LFSFAAPAQETSAKVQAWEGTITIPTYAWHDDVNPVFTEYESSIYYPYTRQDLISKQKADRVYRALFLENEYLRVTCLPELGGRIHSVFDKTTNEEMFHKNDVIKPALIAMRGAWIGGGIEWNVGPHGHTVTIVSPVDAVLVQNDDGSATLVVGNTEKMFRTRWTVRLTLHPGKAYLDEAIRLFNPTDGVHPYYFWNCTGFPNLPGTRFIYPMTLGTDHAGTTFFRWPINEGRDLSWLKNYDTMSSIFAYDCVFDFFGAYDVDRNRGIVSYANHHEVKGKKAWTWGKDDFGVVSQMSLSDAGPEGAQYIEVQTGPLLTQADYGMLYPRQAIAWNEYWYPVHGLGDGFEYATRDAAVQTTRTKDALELRIIATAEFPGAVCTLAQGGKPLLEQNADLSPNGAAQVSLASPPEGPIQVTLRAADGAELLAYETPLDIPKVEPPDLTKKPARADGQPTAEEKYLAGFLTDSQTNPAGARKGYLEALELDPEHVPSLCALAALDIECGNFAAAAEYAAKAARRDPEYAMAWYFLGAAQLGQGQYDAALASGYKAVHTLDGIALGHNLVGRALMNQGNYARAADEFARAMAKDPQDAQNRDAWLTARWAAGDREGVARDIAPIIAHADPTDFIPRALAALMDSARLEKFAGEVNAMGGEKEFTLLEVANFFVNVGLPEPARNLLRGVYAAGALQPGILPCYYLAYYEHRLGDDAAAGAWLDRAAQASAEYAFPARLEEPDILRYATEARPRDAKAHLLLGYLLAGLGRSDDALKEWQIAVDLDPKLSTAWRLLGLNAWKKKTELESAAECYRKALAARPEDQMLYRDLAEILTAQGKRTEAIALVEKMPPAADQRYDVVLWLAKAYVDEKRYDDCIGLLKTAKFSNWEGSSAPRDIYVGALMARGKIRFEQGAYEPALEDFQTALTYPENLEVGARYKLTDAETRYWLGRTLLTLGRPGEARAAWKEGAEQVTSSDPAHTFISVTATQDEYVKRCATALEVLDAQQPQ
jgi:tetratricopeptide (TPR) repeat protein